MTDKQTIIKGLEWWVEHQEGEVLPLAYSAVVETLEALKEQEPETIECKMCGHQLQRDWVWCPWCRWEIARQEGRCYGDE